MEIVSNPTHIQIKNAAKALKDGHLVAFPTETVYGLGADATNEEAVGRIYSVKNRPKDHPIIVHISSSNQMCKWATDIPEYANILAKEFWPGPMTLILNRSNLAKNCITGGQSNVGIRVPQNYVAQKLLNEFEKIGGHGIAAPSANRFRAVSPTTAIAVVEELGNFLTKKDLIIDGGSCTIGIESSIIDCTGNFPKILRSGAITTKMIQDSCGLIDINPVNGNTIKAPGLLDSHYSPNAKVVLDSVANSGDGFLALADISTPQGAIRLASPVSVEDYARELYSALRLSDKKKLKRVVILLPSGEGLAVAIRDRAAKAAAGK